MGRRCKQALHEEDNKHMEKNAHDLSYSSSNYKILFTSIRDATIKIMQPRLIKGT